MSNMKSKKRGLTGKDLMTAGIFTAVYLVIYILASVILGALPILSVTMQFVSSFLLGIPMILYFSKINKFGMVLITYVVNGMLMMFLGLGSYSLILGIVFGLIAELILKITKYGNMNAAILAFAIACIGGNGNAVLWVFGSEKFMAKTAASVGKEYYDSVMKIFNIWWVLPTIMFSAFVGGFLGGMLGKKMFKKHFAKSGVI